MIKRIAMAVILTSMMMVTAAGAAFAGEVTGSGKSTPVRDWQAASICAFSGLNDTYTGDPNVPDAEGFTRTQNWGQLPSELRALVRAGQSPNPHLAPPNMACNPSGGGH